MLCCEKDLQHITEIVNLWGSRDGVKSAPCPVEDQNLVQTPILGTQNHL